MHIVGSDPTGRTAGQYARATVRRLRMRTLVALGVLAVATALLGRAFGLHDVRFLGSEIALLVSMFVISRYVLPLLERRDRGASAEEHVGGLLDELTSSGWRVIHDASLGRGNVDHILIGPAGVFTVETKSHPGPVRVAAGARRDAPPGARAAQGDREHHGRERGAAARVQPRVGGQAAGAPQGRARAPGADAARLSRPSAETVALAGGDRAGRASRVAEALTDRLARESGARLVANPMTIAPFSSRPASPERESRQARLVLRDRDRGHRRDAARLRGVAGRAACGGSRRAQREARGEPRVRSRQGARRASGAACARQAGSRSPNARAARLHGAHEHRRGVACRDGSHRARQRRPHGSRPRTAPAARGVGGLPPGPRAPAVLQTLAWAVAPTWVMDRCARRIGEAFTLTFAPSGMKLVLVSDPEAVKTVFTAPPEVAPSAAGNSPVAPVMGPSSVIVLTGARAHAPAQAAAAAVPRRADARVRGRDRGGDAGRTWPAGRWAGR